MQVDFSKLNQRLEPPGVTTILGRDNFGRDLLSRIVYGTRVSLLVSFAAVALGASVGSLLGLIAGYYGGFIDDLIMRLADVLYAFPAILLALALVAALGPSLTNLIIAIGVIAIPGFARIMRGSVIAIKDREYVEAAKALGTRNWRILIKHVVPNSLAPTIVYGSLTMATALLTEAGLSFLGLGVQAPVPSWGSILADGREFLRNAPFVTNFSGVAILIAVVGFNLLGDGLRDALDPRSHLK
jgi:peptide/nickel transport system permease protein